MLDFQPVKKELIDTYKSYYDYSDALGCEFNFVSAYLWNEEYLLRIAFYDGALIKAYFRDEQRVWGYCMPSGGNVRGAVEAIFRDAAERGQQVQIAYMSRRERDTLEALFPGRFAYTEEPENRDYIYSAHDLAALPGKKFHAKRNHISKFYRTYADDARFSTLDRDNLQDAVKVMALWCDENGVKPETLGEYKVFAKACACFEELCLHGAVLYVHEQPVAMTMGCEISEKCFDVMFEKALRAYDGVYAVINNEFSKTLTKYPYINREEDMGLEGLRKAKLSYNPAIVYERFSAVPVC